MDATWDGDRIVIASERIGVGLPRGSGKEMRRDNSKIDCRVVITYVRDAAGRAIVEGEIKIDRSVGKCRSGRAIVPIAP